MLRFSLIPLVAVAGVAHADAPAPEVSTYAIVVGSNSGGPGQTDLRFAEDDARRVGGILTELGGYANGTVDIVVHPTPDLLRERLVRLGTRVSSDLAAGRQARVFFYYSGHARATALDLGTEQMPLAELRTRLFSVPAALTVVVLDACQSGAFSRVKGAEPAADFSFNSRQHLAATGIAVLASSSGSELSQESEELRSSYFTHHLLVGMRGAGDANHDGQVSIDEAYRYAYHQTLLATAETAVGGQHVSFEVDLKGHGEVPMSYPRAATSSIELPASLEGKTLVQDRRAKAVVAEIYKAKGAAVRIAVAPGDYEVLVRRGDRLARCQISAGAGGATIDLDHCTTEAVTVGVNKGGVPPATEARRLQVELSVLAGPEHRDDYTQRLEDFRYHEQGLMPATAGLALSITKPFARNIWVGGALSFVQLPEWRRADTDTSLKLDWSTTTIAAVARIVQPFASEGFLSRLGLYGQAGLGLAIGRTSFTTVDDRMLTDTYFGPALSLSAGLYGRSPLVDGLGFSMGYAYDYAPAIKNELDDTHATGGHRATFGLSYSFPY